MYSDKYCVCCTNNSNDQPEMIFHNFPADLDRRQIWLENLRVANIPYILEKPEDWVPETDVNVICSNHFELNDFEDPNDLFMLHPDAVPTNFYNIKISRRKKKLMATKIITKDSPEVQDNMSGDEKEVLHEEFSVKEEHHLDKDVTRVKRRTRSQVKNVKAIRKSKRTRKSKLAPVLAPRQEELCSDTFDISNIKLMKKRIPLEDRGDPEHHEIPEVDREDHSYSSLVKCSTIKEQLQNSPTKDYKHRFERLANEVGYILKERQNSDLWDEEEDEEDKKEQKLNPKELNKLLNEKIKNMNEVNSKLKSDYLDLEVERDVMKFYAEEAKKSCNSTVRQLTILKMNLKKDQDTSNDIFNEDQKLALKRGSVDLVKNWSDDTIRKGYELYFVCDTKGYEYLLKLGYPYPPVKILRKKALTFDFEGLMFKSDKSELGEKAHDDSQLPSADADIPMESFNEEAELMEVGSDEIPEELLE